MAKEKRKSFAGNRNSITIQTSIVKSKLKVFPIDYLEMELSHEVELRQHQFNQNIPLFTIQLPPETYSLRENQVSHKIMQIVLAE